MPAPAKKKPEPEAAPTSGAVPTDAPDLAALLAEQEGVSPTATEPAVAVPSADPVIKNTELTAARAEAETLRTEMEGVRAEVEALREQIAEKARTLGEKDRLLADAERMFDQLEAENRRLRSQVDRLKGQVEKFTEAEKAAAPVNRPANIPQDFMLARWKGPGSYGGRCYTLKGDVLPQANGPLVGYFPKNMVQVKAKDQFEPVAG